VYVLAKEAAQGQGAPGIKGSRWNPVACCPVRCRAGVCAGAGRGLQGVFVDTACRQSITAPSRSCNEQMQQVMLQERAWEACEHGRVLMPKDESHQMQCQYPNSSTHLQCRCLHFNATTVDGLLPWTFQKHSPSTHSQQGTPHCMPHTQTTQRQRCYHAAARFPPSDHYMLQ
jgi:hypothetical protein